MSKRLKTYQEFTQEVESFFTRAACNRPVNRYWVANALGELAQMVDKEFENINSMTLIFNGDDGVPTERLILAFKANFMDYTDGNHYVVTYPSNLDVQKVNVKNITEDAKKKV